MKAGWTISAALHGVVLGATLIVFAIKPLSAPPPESISTDIISATDGPAPPSRMKMKP